MGNIGNKDLYPNESVVNRTDSVIGTNQDGLTKTFQLDDLQSLLDADGYTRAQMQTLINNSALKTNVHYRINDAGTDVVGGEPIIVRALNSNTLHAVCLKTTNSASLYSYNISTNVLTEYSVSGVEEAEIDGNKYVRINGQWSLLPIQSDAPADDNEYVRKNGAWTQSTGGGGGVSEAPSDGVTYGRSGVGDGSWNPVYTKTEADSEFDPSGSAAAVQSNLTSHTTNTNIHYADAPSDNKSYIRKNSSWQQQDEPAEDGFIYSRRGATNGGTWVKDPIQGDSPNDGFFYSRKNGAWSKDPIQEDAPSDGSTYGRNNGNYQKIAIQSDAPANGNEYVRKNNAWAISTGGGGVTSDFAARTIPSDSGTVAYNGSVLIVYNNPAFLSDGTTPISSSNIDAEITLKVGSAIGADVPFDAVVDDTRRVITVIPNSDFTKGETYYLTISALKDGDGNVANTPEITFTATFYPAFQSIIDTATSLGITLPSNLNALETLYLDFDALGIWTNGVLKSFNIARYTGVDGDFFKIDWVKPSRVWTEYNNVNRDWSSNVGIKSSGSGLYGFYSEEFPDEWKDLIDSNQFTLNFDRYTVGGGDGLDYLCGINGTGVVGYGLADTIRIRHDKAGTTAGFKSALFDRLGNWSSLIREPSLQQKFGIGGVKRGGSNVLEFANRNVYIGFYSLSGDVSSFLTQMQTAWNNYLATL